MTLTECSSNQTMKLEFIFAGFSGVQTIKLVLFSIFFIIYILTIISNFLIIMIVKLTPSLHTPMYIFIASLSLLEICYVTTTTPNMLSNLLDKCKTISFEGCMTQFYVFFSLGSSECILLTIMSGDRYLAICNPLRYSSLMTTRACIHLVILSFLGGFIASDLTITFIAMLPYCGSNTINHFFCDYPALLTLSCIGSSTKERMFFTLPWSVVLACFLLIICSYVCIIFTIRSSKSDQKKAFSTCVSHLTVVIIFYASVIFMYVRPRAKYDLNKDKVVSIVYSVVTPLLNPMIYSLRNKKFQDAIVNLVLRCFFPS